MPTYSYDINTGEITELPPGYRDPRPDHPDEVPNDRTGPGWVQMKPGPVDLAPPHLPPAGDPVSLTGEMVKKRAFPDSSPSSPDPQGPAPDPAAS